MTNVEDMIERAGFTDDERESGTTGFCAMFALALYRATIHLNPTLVLVGVQRDGKNVKARDGGLFWSHAAVEINGQYYDIEGRQQPEWMIDNYIWGYTRSNFEGCIIPLEPRPFVENIRKVVSARDWRFYTMCKKRLGVGVQ